MLKLSMIRRWKSILSRKVVILLCIVSIAIISICYQQEYLPRKLQLYYDKDTIEPEAFTFDEGDTDTSLFSHIAILQNKSGYKNFSSISRIQQCVILVKESIEQMHEGSTENNISLSHLTEHLRIYDYCFISGGLQLSSVFNSLDVGPNGIPEYNKQLFPYLDFDNNINIPMLPIIYQLTLGEKQVVTSSQKVKNIPKFNENFWLSWIDYSSGKGIVVTMAQSDVPMFKKLLSVLQFIKNTLPVQIVTTGHDFDEETTGLLSQFAMEYDQDIYIVDCSPIINKTYRETHITGFLNKWMATLFTSLSEAILIDIDAVPFVTPNKFFKMKQYKQNGLYMYRDREILKDGAPDTCLDTFMSVLPSKKELSLRLKGFNFPQYMQSLVLQHNLKSDHSNKMENEVFQNFFLKGNMHQVDSGLIVIDRKKQISSLLMAFALHISQVFEHCIHGDKEFFWLGPLLAGNNYNIDLVNAGTMGMLYATEEYGTGICATQIAHVNQDKELMWSNGGLNICKFAAAAVTDFKVNEAFFTSRYRDSESLQAIYDSPLNIDGIVIPNVKDIPWMQTRECTQYRYCAYFKEAKNVKDVSIRNGAVIRLKKWQYDKYNKISNIWNEA